LAARQPAPIAVSLPQDVGAIASRHSAYGANLSPPLTWSEVAGAGAYAVVLQDPDAHGPSPFVHWLIWNIPASAHGLPEGVPSGATPGRPEGAAQGLTGPGTVGYFGPRPPSGVHRYHFQVFSLDGPLALQPGADLAALEKAAAGHVIAKGEVVATYAAPKS
jgi:Raf kinase inhibitor-like YbhB/YbcL family protein